MCGIAALVSSRPWNQRSHILAMCDTLRHRGPDGEGYALFADGQAEFIEGRISDGDNRTSSVALGHRRLSIIDLSDAGAQPMSDASGRFWVTYNGEIYNFKELRAELEAIGYRFRSQCDTEVLVAAYAAWGRACVNRFNGMFAFIIHDRVAETVVAVRDRFGVKPLYFWRMPDGTLAFASEIKAFTVLPGWRPVLDGQSAYDYLVWGLTDHNKRTLLRDVRPVPPGHILDVSLASSPLQPLLARWYELPERSAAAVDPRDAIEQWRELFLDAVRLRLRADVPVGTALSGGLDSSSIVCAVHELRDPNSTATQNTFSARSHEPQFDEGPFMAAVVERTGVRQFNVWPDANELLARLSDIAWYMDEPFGSTSVFAEWKVFETVFANKVKVTLDGHGGDEILAGYRNFSGPFLGELLRHGRLAGVLREGAAIARRTNQGPLEVLGYFVDNVAPLAVRSVLRSATRHTTAAPSWVDIGRLGAAASEPYGQRPTSVASMSREQLESSSLPMQLRWSDRCSMAFSIESRAPFLDYRLVEFTLALPNSLKITNGVNKAVLRESLRDLLPAVVAQRRDKMGFVTPEEVWVRRDWPDGFRAALDAAVESSQGLLTPDALALGRAMIEGGTPFHNRLWRMISFGSWMKRFDVKVAA